MSDVLAYLKKTGMTDTTNKTHKVVGYAKIGNPSDETLLGQVLDCFGSVYTGIVFQSQMMDEFNEGKPWTWKSNGAEEGGHCINLQRRRPSKTKGGPYEYVSWGALVQAGTGFQAHAVEEAWAVVTEDWGRSNGTTP